MHLITNTANRLMKVYFIILNSHINQHSSHTFKTVEETG